MKTLLQQNKNLIIFSFSISIVLMTILIFFWQNYLTLPKDLEKPIQVFPPKENSLNYSQEDYSPKAQAKTRAIVLNDLASSSLAKIDKDEIPTQNYDIKYPYQDEPGWSWPLLAGPINPANEAYRRKFYAKVDHDATYKELTTAMPDTPEADAQALVTEYQPVLYQEFGVDFPQEMIYKYNKIMYEARLRETKLDRVYENNEITNREFHRRISDSAEKGLYDTYDLLGPEKFAILFDGMTRENIKGSYYAMIQTDINDPSDYLDHTYQWYEDNPTPEEIKRREDHAKILKEMEEERQKEVQNLK